MLFISSYTLESSDLAQKKLPITVYCHGLNCKARRVKGLVEQNIIQEPADSFSFDDRKSCLGQSRDIETLKIVTEPDDENYILYGRSRGGAAIISYLALHNPTNIQAIILDAAPADMVDRVDEIQYSLGAYIFQTREHKEWIMRQLYPAYPKNSIPPIASIPNIDNKELPVFLVHSDDDHIVNIRSGLKNYKAFKQAGFQNVYFCNLQHGGHAYNAKGSDCHLYRTALHSFYKKHGFQHDPQQPTVDDLTYLQPTIEQVDEKIENHENQLQAKFKNRRAMNIFIGVHIAFMIGTMTQDK